jgi:CHAD domain-containing protein
MTSELREFELDEQSENNGRISGAGVSAVIDVLGQAFGVVTDRSAPGSGARQHVWLDTFDWRLNRVGLVLDYERKSRGSRLLLSKDETAEAEQPADGWRPVRPRLASDLPAGPVRDRIVKLASPRALLPMAVASSTVSVTRLLNADGKTVARLIVDHSTVTRADVTVALPARLVITEVRGYPGQARRAVQLLAGVPGVTPARRAPFAEALHALGRRPADYSSAIASPPAAQQPASIAVATLLLGLLDTLEQNVDGVLRDIDTEFLHDLRVAVRRTRSALKLLGDVLPDGLAGQYAPEFKWLGDLTTPTRDLDVHLLGLGPMAGQLAAAAPADLEPLRAFLLRRRRREFQRLAAGLRSPRFRALTEDWRKALVEAQAARPPRRRRTPRAQIPKAMASGALASGAPPSEGQTPQAQTPQAQTPEAPAAGPLTAGDLAADRTSRAYRKLTRHGAAITPASPHEALHDLRKRAKELRYVLEFFASLHDPAAYRKALGDLKGLQDCLGEFQDSQVQREEIRVLAEQMLAARAAPAATLLAMGEIAARLAASQDEARAAFAEQFARLAGPDGEQRFAALTERPVS